MQNRHAEQEVPLSDPDRLLLLSSPCTSLFTSSAYLCIVSNVLSDAGLGIITSERV